LSPFFLSSFLIYGVSGQNGEDRDKELGDALEAFFAQFGTLDGHATIVLEEFFRELMGGKE
jgi:hypothetical protein